MNYITIGLDLTEGQYESLKKATGSRYNLGEILSAFCAMQINQHTNLGTILDSLPKPELENLEFEELSVSLARPLSEKLEKWPGKRLEEVLFGCVKELIGQDPRQEALSAYEIDELLADLDPNAGNHGPTSRFRFDRVFEGSGGGAKLIAIRILARAKILNKMRGSLQGKGFSSLQLFIQDRIEREALF